MATAMARSRFIPRSRISASAMSSTYLGSPPASSTQLLLGDQSSRPVPLLISTCSGPLPTNDGWVLTIPRSSSTS
jgi:hypothetical protein